MHDEFGPPVQPPEAAPARHGKPEFSLRAVLVGLVVAAIMGASYPYVVLKLGFGPNVSVVAAIFGYLILGVLILRLCALFGRRLTPFNQYENNIIQTAGTAASQTAFMCVLLAAFDLLAQNKAIEFNISVTPVKAFLWLTTAGLVGVFMAVPLRRHFIVDEKLTYADGIAAGETVIVLNSGGSTATRAAIAMVIGIGASAALMSFRDDAHLFDLLDSTLLFGTSVMMAAGFGIEWSLLAIGSGMILGLRINISMLLGALLSWAIIPNFLLHYGVIAEVYTTKGDSIIATACSRKEVLFWVMWPATGILVAGGLTALALRWRVLARTFKNLSAGAGSGEFPLRWVVIGGLISAGLLIFVQNEMFGQPIWITAAAIAFSVPLALVGLRVLGETNWGPISALSNMMQGIFAFLAPGNIPANMMSSGTTGNVASASQSIMQDYKAGQMVGSSPRHLTYMQLLATPVGAAAVAWTYPLLRSQYGIGDDGLSSPISQKWAGFATVLAKGIEALPPGAMWALLIGAVLGVVLAVVEMKVKRKTLVPSPTGLGIGMLVPASVIVAMCVGGLIGTLWSRRGPKSAGLYLIPLASGLIAGEALIAVIVPLLAALGIIKV